MDEVKATVRLLPRDGGVVEVGRELMFRHSTLIKDMHDDLRMGSGGDEEAVIPLDDKVKADSAGWIVKWLALHADDEAFDKAQLENWEYLEAENKDVDKQFVGQLNNEQLFDLMTAANYLGMVQLLDCLQKAVAAMLEGLTAEQIRQKFHIENDFTEEQRQRMVDDPWGWNDND